MKSFSNQISSTILGKKNPGLNEICTLLNINETPSALVDVNSQSILFINSNLIKMCAFSLDDIWQKPLDILFPDFDLKTVFSGEVREIAVNRRNQSVMKIKGRFDFLDQKAQWVLLRFLSDNEKVVVPKISDDVTPKLVAFARLTESGTLEEVLINSVKLAHEILGVEAVCLFQADPAFPQLKKTAFSGDKDLFPDTLPSSDLIRLDKLSYWKSGSKVLTELHRYERDHEIDYVASAPLAQGEGAFGLLVAAGKGIAPEKIMGNTLELLAVMLISTFQQHLLMDHLTEKITSFQSSRELRNMTIENMQEGLVILNESLKIEEINPAAEWMLGYANWEVKGQSYEDILIGTERLLPALMNAIKGETTHNIGKANLNKRDGQAFPAQIKVIPVITAGRLLGIEVLITDISENEQRKALTQQLEHRAVLGDYTAAFAHDIRNPINNISLGLQLLSAKLNEQDPNQDIINRMQADCTRLTHLMESFLAFSRPLELRVEPIDIELFLKRILDRWMPRMSKVNVHSTLYVEDGVGKILGDARSLENVFTNLITNALDAMAETGDSLTVRVSRNDQIQGHPNVDITFSDNGPGIPDDIKEHIFEPFVTTRQKGTGLGLAITKQIVTAHKGSISVNSFPGGTVFKVQLPASDGEE